MNPNEINPQPTPQTQVPASPEMPSPANPTPTGQVFSSSAQPTLNQAGMTNQPPKKNIKVFLIIGIAIIILIIAAVIIAVTRKKKDTTTYTTIQSSQDSNNGLNKSTNSESVTAPAQTETAINKTITNDVGVTVTISKVIRNFKSEKLEEGKEFILVYVKEVSSGKYSNSSASTSTYKLLSTDGKQLDEAYNLIGSKELTDAGYPLITNAQKSGNNLGEGWLVFEAPKGITKPTLRFVQKETKILGGGTIPAKNFDVVLE